MMRFSSKKRKATSALLEQVTDRNGFSEIFITKGLDNLQDFDKCRDVVTDAQAIANLNFKHDAGRIHRNVLDVRDAASLIFLKT